MPPSPLQAWRHFQETNDGLANLIVEASQHIDIPIEVEDQALAANRDTQKVMDAVAALPGGFHHESEGRSVESIAFFLAEGLDRCDKHQCRHITGTVMPILFLTTPAAITCHRCGPKYAAIDTHPGQCDWCEEPTTIFCETILALGFVTLSMNVCKRCRDEMRTIAKDTAS